MTKIYQRGNQNLQIEEQTTQWPKGQTTIYKKYAQIPFNWPHCIWRETTCIERGTDNTMTKTEKGKKNKQFLSAFDVNLKYNIEYPKIPFKWPHCIWRETTCIERGTDNAMTKTEKGQKNKQCLSASDVNLKYNIEYPKIPFKWPYCIWRKKPMYSIEEWSCCVSL